MVMIPAFQAGGPGSIPGRRIFLKPNSLPKALGRGFGPVPHSISGLVVEYIVAIDVTRVRFPADAFVRIGVSLLRWSFLQNDAPQLQRT